MLYLKNTGTKLPWCIFMHLEQQPPAYDAVFNNHENTMPGNRPENMNMKREIPPSTRAGGYGNTIATKQNGFTNLIVGYRA